MSTMKHVLKSFGCILSLGLAVSSFSTMAALAASFAYVANSGSNTVSVVDRATNSVVATVLVESPSTGMAITPDGAFVYVASCAGDTVSVIATATNTVVGTVPVGVCPTRVAITPNGAYAYVPNRDSNTISVIATTTKTVAYTVSVGAEPTGVAITPDGGFAYITHDGPGSNSVSVVDTATKTVVATVAVGMKPSSLAFTPGGAFAYVTNHGSGTVSVIATATRTVVATVPVAGGPEDVAITPDGGSAYVVNMDSNTISVISTTVNSVVAILRTPEKPRKISITPDGAFAYLASGESSTILVIATATNAVVASIAAGPHPSAVAFAPPNVHSLFGFESLKTLSRYDFFINQGAHSAPSIQLLNPGSAPRSAALEICNPYSDLKVVPASLRVTVNPGSIIEVPLVVNSDATAVAMYDRLLLKVLIDDGNTLYSNVRIHIGPQSLPDLAIESSDIRSAVNPDASVNISAEVHNLGPSTAAKVAVHFYDADKALGHVVIDEVVSGGSRSVSLRVPMAPGIHLLRVVVNSSGSVPEISTTNNSASRLIQAGSSGPDNILITGSLPSSVNTGSLFDVTGRAVYDLNVGETRFVNHVAEGAIVRFAITGSGGAKWAYGDIHTDTNGYFERVLQAPAVPGTYRMTMTVQDETAMETREWVFSAIESAVPVPQSGTAFEIAKQVNNLGLMASAAAPRPTAGAKRPRPFVRKGVTALSASGDGDVLASASTDNNIRIWTTNSGQQRQVLTGSRGLPAALAFNPGGGTLSSGGRDSVVRLWDALGGNDLAGLAGHEHAIRAVAASPDGRFLATAGEESRVLLWDVTGRKLRKILYGPTNFVNGLAFSPDSRLLASAGEDARVLVFDIAAGKVLFTLLGHSGPINAVIFSPDGSVVASGGQDTVIHLWNSATGQPRQVLTGHSAPIRSITFSSDGQLMASGGEDTRIVVWNAATWVMDKVLSGSTDITNCVAFVPNGRLLASASSAGEITIWNVTAGIKMRTIKVPGSQ